jgi:hypothetical protein
VGVIATETHPESGKTRLAASAEEESGLSRAVAQLPQQVGGATTATASSFRGQQSVQAAIAGAVIDKPRSVAKSLKPSCFMTAFYLYRTNSVSRSRTARPSDHPRRERRWPTSATLKGIERRSAGYANQMRARGRVIGLVALAGFLAVAVSAAGSAPPPCCSAACDRCPVSICAAPAVEASVGTPAGAPAILTATIPSPRIDQYSAALSAWIFRMPRLPAHEFRRPMRN